MANFTIDSIPGTLPLWTEERLPILPASSSSQKRNMWSAKAKLYTSRASEPLVHLSPVNICVGGDQYSPIDCLLKIRSDKKVTLFRSTSRRNPVSSSSRTTADPTLSPRISPVYDLSRSGQGQRSTVSLESKTKDSLFSELSSKLELRKTKDPGDNNIWELYYHRNHEFESLVGVPAPGSQVVLVFDDVSSLWRECSGKIVAEEGKGGMYQNHRGLKAGAGWTKLPRIDISEELDPRSVDLIVACWAAKAYFL